MKPETFAILLLVLFAALFAGWYFYDNSEDYFVSSKQTIVRIPEGQTDLSRTDKTPQKRIPMPPRHPVSQPKKQPVPADPQMIEPPLPLTLDDSDSYLKERLPQLVENRKLLILLSLEHFIQKLVVIIDHLPEKNIPRQLLPITPPEPGFVTSGSGEEQVISKRNAARYLPYLQLAEAIPDAALLRLYRGLYPLFQRAYRETGDPKGYFNDRLIQVIDDLLETPEPQGPINIVLHVRKFKYADKSLESRSAGQKILLRMGLENSRRVKQKLQRFRQGLVRKY